MVHTYIPYIVTAHRVTRVPSVVRRRALETRTDTSLALAGDTKCSTTKPLHNSSKAVQYSTHERTASHIHTSKQHIYIRHGGGEGSDGGRGEGGEDGRGEGELHVQGHHVPCRANRFRYLFRANRKRAEEPTSESKRTEPSLLMEESGARSGWCGRVKV